MGCALVPEKYGPKCDAATKGGEKEGTEKAIVKQGTVKAKIMANLEVP